MFAKLTTKIALRKAGIPSNALSIPNYPSNANNSKDGNAALPFANPFRDMQVPKALKSWQTPIPPPVEVASAPMAGTRAPSSGLFKLPSGDGRSTIVVFLRHTGCPFAEKTFLELRRIANKYPDLHCVAISHASQAATDRWVTSIGGAWAVQVIIDEAREVYASWGLGVSTTYHLLNPWTQMAARKLGTNENIWGREVDPSANRWQVGGCWATDQSGWCLIGTGGNKDRPKGQDSSWSLNLSCASIDRALFVFARSRERFLPQYGTVILHLLVAAPDPLAAQSENILSAFSIVSRLLTFCSVLTLFSGFCPMGCREQYRRCDSRPGGGV
ncbi:hypothetical protein B2J93_8240 [Marssonina coronariae]|uniref:Alkyl hydroperoxide reductase subunit C/ Thiol specific antioxidant domain-containing protein n=1 Tax=Diplocarpon coronariae TaxID=2795749 RepID=A0A218YSI1_9HELO|nr:hypothetical protein B2J93_8240 [Marssonina coronariae]